MANDERLSKVLAALEHERGLTYHQILVLIGGSEGATVAWLRRIVTAGKLVLTCKGGHGLYTLRSRAEALRKERAESMANVRRERDRVRNRINAERRRERAEETGERRPEPRIVNGGRPACSIWDYAARLR